QVGSDTFNVSSNAPANTGDLNSIDGLLFLVSGNDNGTDVLNISESGNALSDAVTVSLATGRISGTVGGGWTIFELANNFGGGVNVSLGTAADIVNVQSTLA